MRIFLINHFGDTIDFPYPVEHQKSMMVFNTLRTRSRQMAETIRSINPFKVSASIIRKQLSTYDFNLNNKFNDAEDLRESLMNMPVPGEILRFFGEIYNFDPDSYQNAASDVLDDSRYQRETDEANDDVELEENVATSRTLSTQRCRKIQSLFQIMYYIYHNGKRRTHMHIMNSVSIHSLGHGGKLFTNTLNHQGLAISYSELRRYQHDLAAFAAQDQGEPVQIPSHFNPIEFTSGAIDNWDHKVSEHDTVAVLYQNNQSILKFLNLCEVKLVYRMDRKALRKLYHTNFY